MFLSNVKKTGTHLLFFLFTARYVLKYLASASPEPLETLAESSLVLAHSSVTTFHEAEGKKETKCVR